LAALLAATADDTVYTTAFGDGWPDVPHRVLRIATERAAAWADQIVGQGVYEDQRWGGRPLVSPATDGIHYWRGGCHGHVRRLRCR
jgi:hypothetical protein